MRYRNLNNLIGSIRFKLIKTPIKKRRILRLINNLKPVKTEKELMRLGGSGDGGYLVPDDLKGIHACFSPGVGNLSNFELECANLGMKIFMADGSVDNPIEDDRRFLFIKKFIGNSSNEGFITLEEWINSVQLEDTSDLILQMDIEGHEYDVLNATTAKTLNKFRIIVIEFHRLHSLWDDKFYQEASASFSKLLQNHYCVHIHPNNCCGIKDVGGYQIPSVAEFTFIRKDRVKSVKKVQSLPHILDEDNTGNESISMPDIWY
ncbi:Methyltransferase FkbM domain-containing protein [Gillisia sp. Hel1_33_143]|nr:Methyltransferase FkbM domain-containing protein [Gillisia sp. Hel1_33_143]